MLRLLVIYLIKTRRRLKETARPPLCHHRKCLNRFLSFIYCELHRIEIDVNKFLSSFRKLAAFNQNLLTVREYSISLRQFLVFGLLRLGGKRSFHRGISRHASRYGTLGEFSVFA